VFSCSSPARRITGTGASSAASVSDAHAAIKRRSTVRCSAASSAQVAYGSSGSKKRSHFPIGRLAFERTLDRVDVIPIDGQDVVERRLDRREEARAERGEVRLRQPSARREQPMVRPALLQAIVKK
jgi:hypothetical protein